MKTVAAGLLALALFLPSPARAGVSPGCKSAMEQAVSGYSGCRLLAQSKNTKQPDAAKFWAGLSKCSARFESAVYKALARFGASACPPTSFQGFQGYVDTFARGAVAAAAGDGLPNLEPCVPEPTPVATPEPTPQPECTTPFSVDNGKGGTYTDNCDGTVTDSTTGLQWEKKTPYINGVTVEEPSLPHHVGNVYTWTAVDASPWPYDGTAKTVFLDRLNCEGDYAVAWCTPWLGGGWRLPTIEELSGQTAHGDGFSAAGGIIDLTAPGCGPPTYNAPCINPIFGATMTQSYWSSSEGETPRPHTPVYSPVATWVLTFHNAYAAPVARAVLGASGAFCRAVRNAP